MKTLLSSLFLVCAILTPHVLFAQDGTKLNPQQIKHRNDNSLGLKPYRVVLDDEYLLKNSLYMNDLDHDQRESKVFMVSRKLIEEANFSIVDEKLKSIHCRTYVSNKCMLFYAMLSEKTVKYIRSQPEVENVVFQDYEMKLHSNDIWPSSWAHDCLGDIQTVMDGLYDSYGLAGAGVHIYVIDSGSARTDIKNINGGFEFQPERFDSWDYVGKDAYITTDVGCTYGAVVTVLAAGQYQGVVPDVHV